MRIEQLIVTPIAIGDPPLLNAAGLHAPFALRIVMQLVTEVGVVGLSEIPGSPEALDVLGSAAESLRGVRVVDTQAMTRGLSEAAARLAVQDARGDRSWDDRVRVHVASALEVASLDALARRLECRLADLIGGVVRNRIPVAGYLFFKYAGAGGDAGFSTDPAASGWAAARQAEALDIPALVRQGRSMVEAFGFTSLKVKAGILDPDTEVGAVLALREEFGPGMPLRIDPNAVWSFRTALAQGRRLRGIVEYLEDPVRGQEQMGALRRELGVPLATNMCTAGFADLPGSIAHASEDIILADHHFWGGLRPCIELASFCAVFGRDLSMHSNSHAGVSFAAMIQLAAALPGLRHAIDTHYPWQADDVVRGGRLRIDGGEVAVPDGPGLGVELDQDALKRAHEAYLTCGLTRRDDEAEMQKVQPGWQFMTERY